MKPGFVFEPIVRAGTAFESTCHECGARPGELCHNRTVTVAPAPPFGFKVADDPSPMPHVGRTVQWQYRGEDPAVLGFEYWRVVPHGDYETAYLRISGGRQESLL